MNRQAKRAGLRWRAWILATALVGCGEGIEENDGEEANEGISWNEVLPWETETTPPESLESDAPTSDSLMSLRQSLHTSQPPNFSVPLAGLTEAEQVRFLAGAAAFAEVETVADGLGPIFNDSSCGACHLVGGLGGGANVFESRFGRMRGRTFDPLQSRGGTLQQLQSIGSEGTPPGCFFPTEVIPDRANVRTLRRSTPLFGLGLVDNLPEEVFYRLAALQRRFTPKTAGRVAVAINLATTEPQVSRFGWKAQIPNLFQFSGDAYNNEMGITTPLFPLENCPNGAPDCDLVRRCDPIPGVDDDNADLVLFTDFMTFLAPPSRGRITRAVKRGERVFHEIGCANCHVPTLITGPSDSAALDRRVFHPFSDFLLHDMGAGGDGIGPNEGDATGVVVNASPSEMRTAPLWGLRVLDRFMHDGSALTVEEAIFAHDGQGARARERFRRLRRSDKKDLLQFLDSL